LVEEEGGGFVEDGLVEVGDKKFKNDNDRCEVGSGGELVELEDDEGVIGAGVEGTTGLVLVGRERVEEGGIKRDKSFFSSTVILPRLRPTILGFVGWPRSPGVRGWKTRGPCPTASDSV
jgi:hypothetical protein